MSSRTQRTDRRGTRDRISRMFLRLGWLLAIVIGAAAGLGAQAAVPPPAVAPRLTNEARTARHFERIRREPPALRAFLRAMPKGADLHLHLGGSIYAESMIQWAAELPLCIDTTDLRYVAAAPASCPDAGRQRPAGDVLRDSLLYRSVIDALSVRHWDPARKPGHYQFFDTFGRFNPVVREVNGPSTAITGRALAEVAHRAALQNVHHLEPMMGFGRGVDAGADTDWNADPFAAVRERMLAAGLRDRVAEQRAWLDGVEAESRKVLGCGTAAARPGCDVSIRYIAYALRGVAPHLVFGQALAAFEMAAADPRVVGVNLVMPEDGYLSMRDHPLHMRMFRFLGRTYPSVNVALHAGELSFGLVPPEQLGLHVRQAVEIAGARRIGHGTDVMHDADPASLLRDMARRRIAVEVSFGSSDIILGIRGARHPLRQYLRAGVPVVIATDDEGVSRSDLTNEYQRAVEEHGASYAELKRMSRDSIALSFLPPDARTQAARALDRAFAAFEARHR
jgi:adenosine deaminase